MLRKLSVSCVTHLWEGSWKPVPVSYGLVHLFSFADFDLYSFAIINQSYDYNYMLSAVNPPMKSNNLDNVQSDG